jgi:hypothetical protein
MKDVEHGLDGGVGKVTREALLDGLPHWRRRSPTERS